MRRFQFFIASIFVLCGIGVAYEIYRMATVGFPKPIKLKSDLLYNKDCKAIFNNPSKIICNDELEELFFHMSDGGKLVFENNRKNLVSNDNHRLINQHHEKIFYYSTNYFGCHFKNKNYSAYSVLGFNADYNDMYLITEDSNEVIIDMEKIGHIDNFISPEESAWFFGNTIKVYSEGKLLKIVRIDEYGCIMPQIVAIDYKYHPFLND